MTRPKRTKATTPSSFSPSGTSEAPAYETIIDTSTSTTTATSSATPVDGMELRRKTAPSSSRNLADNIISHESFSLDHPVPETEQDGKADDYDSKSTSTSPTHHAGSGSQSREVAHGFMGLPLADRRNFLLLVLLYFLQGIPMGLAMGSVPFIMKNRLSYGAIGIFSLASYPYSLKLFWSPIVDAVWSRQMGRRKSWIVPIQFISGIGMLWLSRHVEEMMAHTGEEGGPTVWGFTSWWFFLVFLCATQDIAVDGWALTLLSASHVSYASTAQTVGLMSGHFMSYTVFLAFNSSEFANRYFRTIPHDSGLISLGRYLQFWGWAYILVTIGLALWKKEERTRTNDSIRDVYKTMWGVLRLRHIQILLFIHLIAKIGFQANDGATKLKLLDKGFGKDNMALTVLIDFPFEIALGYYAGKWSEQYTPMRLWSWGFMGRLGAALVAQATVMMFPSSGVVGPTYLMTVVLSHLLSTFTETIMFVSVSAFHAKISDPVIGGTYMTLLATFCNLGGTFPRFFVLRLIDAMTSATCQPGASTDKAAVFEPFSCSLPTDKERCLADYAGARCVVHRDGYYLVNILCVLVGLVSFVWVIRPRVTKLQQLPLRAWRLVQ